MSNTSAHFSDGELECHHCHVNGCTKELVLALEQLRRVISDDRGADTPLLINDAYRCSQHNAHLEHAARGSQHVLGRAADVRVPGLTAVQLYRYALKVPVFKGIGRNDHAQYLHVDVRETPARWCYTPGGGTLPWSEPPAAS